VFGRRQRSTQCSNVSVTIAVIPATSATHSSRELLCPDTDNRHKQHHGASYLAPAQGIADYPLVGRDIHVLHPAPQYSTAAPAVRPDYGAAPGTADNAVLVQGRYCPTALLCSNRCRFELPVDRCRPVHSSTEYRTASTVQRVPANGSSYRAQQ